MGRRTMKKLLGSNFKRFVIIGVIFVVGLTVLLNQSGHLPGRNTTSIQRTEKVVKGDLSATTNISGQTFINEATLSFLQSGKVGWIGVKEGDTVFQGQALASIDQTATSSQLSKTEANLRSTQAALDKVLDDIHLFQYGNGGFANVGSSNETQTQKTARQQAEAARDTAVFDIQNAKSMLSQTVLTAPFDGVVSKVNNVYSGQNITTGNPIITVLGGEMKFLANVDETEYKNLHLQDKGTVTLDAFPNEKFIGKIIKIGISATKLPTGGSIIPVELSLPNDPKLKNNLNGEVEFNITDKRNVLILPRTAVKYSVGKPYVMIPGKNGSQKKDIQTGNSLGTKIEVVSGLSEGDEVFIGK